MYCHWNTNLLVFGKIERPIFPQEADSVFLKPSAWKAITKLLQGFTVSACLSFGAPLPISRNAQLAYLTFSLSVCLSHFCDPHLTYVILPVVDQFLHCKFGGLLLDGIVHTHTDLDPLDIFIPSS